MDLMSEAKEQHLVARLRTQMLRKGLNPKTLAERANVGRSFVYDILSGKSTNPTSSKIAAIAEVMEVSVQYLLSGVGTSAEGGDIVEIPSLKVEESMSGSIVVNVELKQKPFYFSSGWVKNDLQLRPQDLRAIYVTGDSMEPTLSNKDMILIDLTKQVPNPAGVFVVFDGVGLVVKRLEMICSNRVSIMSDNKKYSSYEAEINELNIIGKVVWLAREL